MSEKDELGYPVWMSDLPVDFWRDREVLDFIDERRGEALNNGKTSTCDGDEL